MSDTIELLEAIGKNAGLRYATADELAHALTQADASDTLKAAVIAGDSALLSTELGHKPMRVTHDPHTGGHEEDPDHDHDGDDPEPSPKPDQDKPSQDREARE